MSESPIQLLDTQLSDSNSSEYTPCSVRWLPDAEVHLCCGCKLVFDWVNRKHHCRCCGQVFCDTCTSFRSLIPKEKILTDPSRQYLAVNINNPHRVCEKCYELLLPQQNHLRHTNSNAMQENTIHDTKSQRLINAPYSFTLREEIRKAAFSVHNFMDENVINDQSIPLPLLKQAYGIAFLTVLKVGFIFTGRVGTGLVLCKLSNGQWSAPSAIGTAGIGWGVQFGGELTDFVIILNTQSAVDLFCSQGQITLGAEIGISAGPVGRRATGGIQATSDFAVAPCYSYSHSKGLFVGISLEGSVILQRSDVNRTFYGHDVQVDELLKGVEAPPIAAKPLYDALEICIEKPSQ